MFKKLNATIALVMASLMFGMGSSQTIPEVTRSQFMMPPEDLHNFRYCEVIPIFRQRLTLNVEVYNTINLNDCPAEAWNALDAEAMTQDYGAVQVILNGPRYWVINKVVAKGETATGKTVDFGGIEMNFAATLETKLWESTVGSESYSENEVQRSTTFTYSAGNMVYELISADGDVYRMQSYSQSVDPNLSIDDLETLGERLSLPEGWTYKARVLTEDSLLEAEGLAFVISDDLLNAYQKITTSEAKVASSSIINSQEQSSTRGQRICELYELTLEDEQLSLNIWNNLAFHDCPDEWLEQINRADFFVGGPRWRSVDAAVTVDESGKPMDITSNDSHVAKELPAGLGLTMGLAAKVVLDIPVEQLEQQLNKDITTIDDIPRIAKERILSSIETTEFYTVTTVERQQPTKMMHFAGSKIFVLNDGNCDYAMKYYTNIVDPSLVNEEAIAELGDKLTLPEGYSFEVRVLDENLTVAEVDGIAYVMTDEFGNSYDRFSCSE